jgi:hypothetical protein
MQWYWCLTHERVESAEERDDLENTLGPYATEEAARNWRDTVESRNDAWDEEDKRWRGDDEDDDTGDRA